MTTAADIDAGARRAGDSPRAEDSLRAQEAIRYHYDVSNTFYQLWLDRSLAYSCAMPAAPDDSLEHAQQRKLDFHLNAVGIGPAAGVGAAPAASIGPPPGLGPVPGSGSSTRVRSLLDVGCGWGAVLRLARDRGVPRVVGLTLSDEQAAHLDADRGPGFEVHTRDWRDYTPDAPFDGIISIGAFEHFARPEDTAAERIERYREFFGRVRDWLTDDGVLSLQTIAYANMPREKASAFIQEEIFPAAELPTLAEITAAAEGILETRLVRNDRLDYAWTFEQWAARLRARRDEARALVGPEVVARYERYLRMNALGCRMGKICLYRLVFRPYSRAYFRSDV
ncbi:cyclopropane-fatty-acyl-phospholipid synthase family protein [Frankia sp. AgPm24]|uniref:SAM-dependent methyltransferase n=1 Tax=Frankia sp. AgPm24 TaxID=631128 RepID=UPI00200E8CE6|nr:cyclopropane-fatty-acyl-phospholipid synthase family protein [Frankia sp. AgPm24]MCK9925469.1 cyclopropane-fatty-acyl-phospholipid synthase family protein [Frankia sp. AgPm24]